MANIERNLIEYIGIEECQTKDKKSFTQINLEKVFCIPGQKPNIEQINTVWATACVKDYEIVVTPVGKSLEGQILTGYKLLVCGEITIKIEYVADETLQSVHTAHTSYPFCAYIVLPGDINKNARLGPSIIIEDILAEQMDLRCIYTNVTIAVLTDIY